MLGRKCSNCEFREKLIETQQKQITDLMDRLQELVGNIHYNQVEAHKTTLWTPERDTKLHTSEDEEDAIAIAQRPDGSVDQELLEQLLAEANFMNTEIDLD